MTKYGFNESMITRRKTIGRHDNSSDSNFSPKASSPTRPLADRTGHRYLKKTHRQSPTLIKRTFLEKG